MTPCFLQDAFGTILPGRCFSGSVFWKDSNGEVPLVEDAADAAMGQALEELDAAADLLKATDTYRSMAAEMGAYRWHQSAVT